MTYIKDIKTKWKGKRFKLSRKQVGPSHEREAAQLDTNELNLQYEDLFTYNFIQLKLYNIWWSSREALACK